ncbi:hypothetical protein, partial [Desulfallas sp. Bu1-1]|uniref:hypothetical protein n=1 Tax=Desulfallas sp. Bu1-1 TaxID=2787620 RepID=UPI001A9B6AC4
WGYSILRAHHKGATICGAPGRWDLSKSRARSTKETRPPFASRRGIIRWVIIFILLLVPRQRHVCLNEMTIMKKSKKSYHAKFLFVKIKLAGGNSLHINNLLICQIIFNNRPRHDESDI